MPQSVTVASHPALGIFKNRKTEFQQFNEALLLEARVEANEMRSEDFAFQTIKLKLSSH